MEKSYYATPECTAVECSESQVICSSGSLEDYNKSNYNW